MNRRTFIKICGLRDAAMAELAVNAGADAVGMMFHAASPRAVDIAAAKEIAAQVRGRAQSVALFVNKAIEDMAEVVDAVRPDVIQLHGDESPADVSEIIARFGLPVWCAVRVSPGVDLLKFQSDFRMAARLLLDADSRLDGQRQFGGTGHSFDWNLIPDTMKHDIMLAGGLNPANVAEAVAVVRPWGVDVSSGVEVSRGIKSSKRIIEFIEAVRKADERA